jgi:predicted CXXCH cytochrome family protein
MRGWKIAGAVATLAIVLSLPLYAVRTGLGPREAEDPGSAEAAFVGRERCTPCHAEATRLWTGSHHDLAMDAATDSTVLGDFDDALFEHRGVASRFFRRGGGFFVETEGPGGERGEFEIAYTFGVEPLQQYLVPFPEGRLQALSIAWDTQENEWFHLYPDEEIPADDWLHWTRGGQNWNGMCAECHSTNLRKGFDPETRSFSTTWSEIDVSCEACHGPGSRHVAWAETEPMARPPIDDFGLVVATGNVTPAEQVELCAPCHSRRAQLADYDHTATDMLESFAPALLEEHLYFADGQIRDEVYVYGSFVQSKMYRNGVRCSDCHDVHSLKLREEGNALCLQCHRADTYDVREHHFHKKVVDGKPSDGALCVKCHMPERPYMVIDWRADHSFRVPRPDLTRDLGTPNACAQAGCHDDKPLEWLLEHDTAWYGRSRPWHYGEALRAGQERQPGAAGELARLAADPLYPSMVRASALSLLAAQEDTLALSAVSVALGEPDPLLRYTAARSIAPPATPAEAERLVPLLFDPLRVIRAEAASQLAGAPEDWLKPYQREALAEALDEYRLDMAYCLDFAFAGHNLGNLSVRLGDAEAARSYYRLALAVDDLFLPAKMNLAVLENQAGRNDVAERLLREALAAYPQNTEAAYSLGLLLAEMERLPEAATYLQQAAVGEPDAPRVQYNAGLALQAVGRVDEAEAALVRALTLAPDDPAFLLALADHYLRRGRLDEAAELADRMIALNPQDRTGYEVRSAIERARRP